MRLVKFGTSVAMGYLSVLFPSLAFTLHTTPKGNVMRPTQKLLLLGISTALIGFGAMVPSLAAETPAQEKAEHQTFNSRESNEQKAFDANEAKERAAFNGTAKERRAFNKEEHAERTAFNKKERSERKDMNKEEKTEK